MGATFLLPNALARVYPLQRTPSMAGNTQRGLSRVISRNVVVAGGTGVGKSSFINLVTDRECAGTGNGADGVTTRMNCHPWQGDTHGFRLWDTPGVDEGSRGKVSPKDARRALRELLEELGEEGGVHLLIVCMRYNTRITKAMKRTYETILDIRNKVSPQIPVVAVVTELENQGKAVDILSSMEEWWSSHQPNFDSFKMAFSGHACLTTIPDNCYPEMPGRRAKCRQLAQNLLIKHSLPLKLTHNIVVVGQTGAGKSSLINLITGTDSAVVTSDAQAVTVGTSYHDWVSSQTRTFRLWDTPGLGEGPSGAASPKLAHNTLQSLLTELGRGTGVHLIILCLRGGRQVTKSMKQTYDTVRELRDRISPDTPIVAVITNLEPNCNCNDGDVLTAMNTWWDTNSGTLPDLSMSFAAHACITTLSDDAYPRIPGRRNQCQRLVRELVVGHALTPTIPVQDLHVILFGETGVGKSSLVNLLTGWQAAQVSADSVACTLASTEYQFQLGGVTLRLWDTVGLEEPEKDKDGYVGAIEKAVELVQRLNSSGGISLFLFCVRGNRVTKTMESNYRLFYEVLGKRQVPIALVITHLEREEVMEDWWQRNNNAFKQSGINASGHACITALEGHPKCPESRNAVEELLWEYADKAKFSLPLEKWLGRLLSGLNSLLGFIFPKRKDLTHLLMKRCNMAPDVAQRVAACITQK